MDFKREVINIFDDRRVFKVVGDSIPNPTGYRHRIPLGDIVMLTGFSEEFYPIVMTSNGKTYTLNNEDLKEIE